MKDILFLIKKYFQNPIIYIAAIFFTTLQGLSEIILPRYMGDIVNKGIMTGDMDEVFELVKN